MEIHYSCARPDRANLAVGYVGGRVRVFVMDTFLIERLLEHLEREEGSPAVDARRTEDLLPRTPLSRGPVSRMSA